MKALKTTLILFLALAASGNALAEEPWAKSDRIIQERFEHESVDSAWADSREAEIRLLIQETKASELDYTVVCKSTSCVVTIATEDSDMGEVAVAVKSQIRELAGPAKHRFNQDTSEVTIHFKREGFGFPAVDDTVEQ